MKLLLKTIATLAQIHLFLRSTSSETSNEIRIKNRLAKVYDKTSRPVQNDNQTVSVSVGISLYHILETHEKSQTIVTLLSIRLSWADKFLSWNSENFGNISEIRWPAHRIWIPDIIINNNADNAFGGNMNTNAIISSDGTVLWMYPAVVKTYCTLNVRYFPFDTQQCDIVFISWTYSGVQVNLTNEKGGGAVNYYNEKNQQWNITDIIPDRHERIYVCCPNDPYPHITFTLCMKRRSMFYVFNLVFPCLLIYGVAFLSFALPVESNDKVNLEITILLALVVFLMVFGETLPPTPDAIPLLGMFFGLTMIMVSLALVMAVVVTNVHMRRGPVPRWLEQLVRLKPSVQDSSNRQQAFQPRKWFGQKSTRQFRLPTARKVPAERLYRARDTSPVPWFSRADNHSALQLDSNESTLQDFQGRKACLASSEVINDNGSSNYDLQKIQRTLSLTTTPITAATTTTTNADSASERLSSIEKDHEEKWHQVGKKLDTFFFWLFFILSIITLIATFTQPSLVESQCGKKQG